MSKYLSKVTINVNHFGDEISFTLKQLLMKDLLLVRELSSQGEAKMLIAYVDLLPAYLESVSGLKDANGNDLPVEALKDAYFLNAVAELATKHVQAAVPENPTLPGGQ